MYIKNQKFLVLGVSKSGYAVAKKVIESGGKCYLFEQLKSDKIKGVLDELVSLGAVICNEENVDNVLDIIDVLVISPGVPINHTVAVNAKRKGKRIIGELEFGYNCLMPTLVAVTGTNGKTTTCTMINAILEGAKSKNFLVGNVGEPITSKVNQITNNDICVTEVSSFQLESVYAFNPHISCVLNIAPDHLERHYSMENYLFLKKRIFKNQRESEYSVFNYDDEVVRGFYNESRAKTLWISTKEKVEGGYIKDGALYYFDEKIIEENKLALTGLHNVYNALFAIVVAKLLKVGNEVIAETLKNLKGVRHRIEFIKTVNGVDYYNDSKATNVASTVTALENMKKPTVLIIGGSEKGEAYDNLFAKIKETPVKHVIITGDSKYSMLDASGKNGYSSVTVTPDFEYAVKIARLISEEGDNVLLSPACASFDCFKDYEERGDKFVSLIGEFN